MKVLFFAGLKETLGTGAIEVSEPDILNVHDLVKVLQQRSEVWHSALDNEHLKVAVNQEISDFNASIRDEDEVAFFPPVTGG